MATKLNLSWTGLLICAPLALMANPSSSTKIIHKPSSKAEKKRTIPFKKYITGNPIGRHDDYTLNGNNDYITTITCHFINTGKHKVNFDIWSQPDAPQPFISVALDAATKMRPSQKMVKLRLRLFTHWWCHILTPSEERNNLNYCTYISIADSNLTSYHPFAKHQLENKNFDASYKCDLTPAKQQGGFFAVN